MRATLKNLKEDNSQDNFIAKADSVRDTDADSDTESELAIEDAFEEPEKAEYMIQPRRLASIIANSDVVHSSDSISEIDDAEFSDSTPPILQNTAYTYRIFRHRNTQFTLSQAAFNLQACG